MEVDFFSGLNTHKGPSAMSQAAQSMSGHMGHFHSQSQKFQKIIGRWGRSCSPLFWFPDEVFSKLPPAWPFLHFVFPRAAE